MEPRSSSEPIDRSRVLDVRPLNWLVPVLPKPPGVYSDLAPNSAPLPFTCFPPFGPFPPDVRPFYPFLISNDSQNTAHFTQNLGGNIPAPIPLNSFRIPSSTGSGRCGRPKNANSADTYVVEEDDGHSDSHNDQYQSGHSMNATDVEDAINLGLQSSQAKRKMTRHGEEFEVESLVNSILTAYKLNELDDFRRSSGDKDTVGTILLAFSLLRRRLFQLEEASGSSTGIIKRPDLKAGTLLLTKGVRTNFAKRVGHVPGIEIGDIFFFRMELCIVGLHAPSMAGIDYMSVRVTIDEEPVAVSIVSSGGYDDEGDDTDVIIYTGQGGVQRQDKKMFDQKLERGNLALEKSLHRGNDVRVIRGIKDAMSTGKIYIYDGLYKIQESWVEKNKFGCNVFKYKLIRLPGQPEAFSLWKSIQQWREKTATPMGMILPDLTSGAESQPVTLVNGVDDEKGPAHFTYAPMLRYIKPFSASKPSTGCHCLGVCQSGDTNCICNRRNDGSLPYSSQGVIVTNKSLIYECGQTCVCPPNCRNRISQAGIKVHLEVFKTKNRGWGLRSWDPIRAGTFICEFAGDVISSNSVDHVIDNEHNYIFDTTRHYKPLEFVSDSSAISEKTPFPLVINAKRNGNVARFMNHSCMPNVFWQPVLRESNYDSYLHVSFFAIRHIPPMQELTYDYGIVPTAQGDKGKKKCFCESEKCRGQFFG